MVLYLGSYLGRLRDLDFSAVSELFHSVVFHTSFFLSISSLEMYSVLMLYLQ